jgi:chondroitin-sulfate-ABC endolyase/exolyase
MKSFKLLFFVAILFVTSIQISAQPKQFTNPAILSFENGLSPAIGDSHSQLSISREHFKHLSSSLCWKWNSPEAQWSIKQDVCYKQKNHTGNGASVSTFVFWLYSTNPVKDGKIKVEFLKDGRVCCFFEYGIDFTGWRGAWITFDRDMQGKPEEGMNEMRIVAPNTNSGQLFFDHIILSSLQDVRQHTADFQAPYVNPRTKNHWLVLLQSWKNNFDISVKEKVTASEQNSINEIQNRLTEMLLEGKKVTSVQKLSQKFDEYNVHENSDGTVSGLPVFFERFSETYDTFGAGNYKSLYNNAMGLSRCNQLMFDMAVSYQKCENAVEKNKISDMYVLLMRHLLDQGFQAGSGLGTLHHLGYSMRNFYTAAYLMKDPLTKAHLDQQVQQAMEWFSGTGEVKTKPLASGMDIDAFNTSLVGRLSSILMLKDNTEKTRYLYAFTRWIDNGFLYTDGTTDAFKPDGTIFHHRGNYPAYAVGGLEGAVIANSLLYNTDFQLKPIGRDNLRKALLAMRNYCNLQTWPLSLSGRHPDGKGHLFPDYFARLALTGTPDYSQKIDRELAAAYLRLETKVTTKYKRIFQNEGITPENSPAGNWSYNYSCLGVHRRDNWLVTAMGFSRYLWGTEIYPGANMYGRYLNHGNLQILATGEPISNTGSGFNGQGWDWNHFPGTTAAVLPLNELRARVQNVDPESGYEEMLLSDETFAGSISLQNKQGAFAMKLHENNKYNGSLHARKSYFFFDNRVVALGSGICSDLPDRPVHTTLFQVFLPKPDAAIEVDGATVTDFPYSNRLENTSKYLSDGLNNYFFVKQGNVQVIKSLQKSLDQETEESTQNNFALAVIDNGIAPKNATYEYMVFVQPTVNEVQSAVKQFKSTSQTPYKVLEQDSVAHIVFDKASATTGYAIFEAGNVKASTEILSVNNPCLIMTTTMSSNKMAISVCDPDFHFYQGSANEQYDLVGKRIEKSVYSMPWINNPSADSELEVKLKGNWKIVGESEYISVKNVIDGITTLSVKCKNAFSRETTLQKL